MQAPKLTNRVSAVTLLGCQSSFCVMINMCNVLSNWLVFQKIETSLYSCSSNSIVYSTTLDVKIDHNLFDSTVNWYGVSNHGT